MQKYCQKDINRYMNTVVICTYVSMLYHRCQLFTTDKNLISRYNIKIFDKKV